jgi:hypothetical protein
MDYNLWLSEDSRYTLGYRMGIQATEARTAPDPRVDAPARPNSQTVDQVESPMETFARQMETAST